jgi:flagellar biosynthetic protein FliR
VTNGTGFDLFAPGAASALVLTACRTGGVVLIAPVFSGRVVPAPMRTAVVVLLALLLQPTARAAAATTPLITPGSVLSETLIGLVIGLGAAVIVAAAESAGELLAAQIGLSGAAVVDPLSLQQSTALGQFMHLFALSLLLSTNGHLVMLDALAASVRQLPLGAPIDASAGLGEAVGTGAHLFALGFRFAAPVVAVVLIANVALAVLSRAAPQLNILQLAFPVQILVGLSALIVSIPVLGAWFLGWDAAYDGIVGRVFSALVGGGVR